MGSINIDSFTIDNEANERMESFRLGARSELTLATGGPTERVVGAVLLGGRRTLVDI